MEHLDRRQILTAAAVGTAGFLATPKPALAQHAGKPGPSFGPPAGIAALAYNENPFGPSSAAIAAMTDQLKTSAFYPNAACKYLQAMIAERLNVGTDQVVIGGGSFEILCALILAMKGRGTVLAPALVWDMSLKYGARLGAQVKRIPLAADMGIDLDALAAANGPDVGMIHICNPNNPTGMLLDPDRLRAFIRSQSRNTIIVVDEAYTELTDDPQKASVVDLIKECPNLVITRTFSKIHALAGARIGYGIAAPETARAIWDHIMTLGATSNTAGLAAAIASYQDEAFIAFSRARIAEARHTIMDAAKRAGLEALPAQGSFVFVKVPDADRLQRAMAEHKVMIRGAFAGWPQWSRVSAGKPEDVRRYTDLLPRLVGV